MHLKIFSIIFFAVIALASCESTPEFGLYQIEGAVIDSITTLPISKIRVIRKSTKFLLFADTVYTDIEGKYKFEFTDYYEPVTQFAFVFEDVDGVRNGGEYTSREFKFIFSDWIENNESWRIAKKNQQVRLQLK